VKSVPPHPLPHQGDQPEKLVGIAMEECKQTGEELNEEKLMAVAKREKHTDHRRRRGI